MKATDYFKIFSQLDSYPDDAIIPDPVGALFWGTSLKTYRRRRPAPAIQISPKLKGSHLGTLRRRRDALARAAAQPAA
jgi:hypothetical protein